jgi:enamine deaminase RidA (YjgF/YER057c/UK114 family)
VLRKPLEHIHKLCQKNNIVFLSGQIPLNPETMDLVEGIEEQIHQVFKNMIEVIKAADSST